jgi:hypothetical protein
MASLVLIECATSGPARGKGLQVLIFFLLKSEIVKHKSIVAAVGRGKGSEKGRHERILMNNFTIKRTCP